MKRARFSDEQIVRILRETDKDTVVEVAKGQLQPRDLNVARS